MCKICVDFKSENMTAQEGIASLYEIKEDIGKVHAREVHDFITKDDEELTDKQIAMLDIIEEYAGIEVFNIEIEEGEGQEI